MYSFRSLIVMNDDVSDGEETNVKRAYKRILNGHKLFA